jgi:hypothetical protein
MLSKEELANYNTLFWSDFKDIMSDCKSANGKKINWLSYPTHIKNFYLRLFANKTSASLCFDIQYKDESVRSVFWEQMLELKKVLTDSMKSDGIWFEHCKSDTVDDFCRIEWRIENVNYFNYEDKKLIYDFLKIKLLSFDEFYQNFKEILVFLAK